MRTGKSRLRALGTLVKQWVWMGLLAVLLTACGASGQTPNRQLVEHALTQELGQTQAELSQQLRLATQPTGVKLEHVTITSQTPLVIEDLPAYRVRGTYDFTWQVQQRQVAQQKNPFELYLQRQKEGKTWRIAYPQVDAAGQPTWITQRVQSQD